MTTIGEVIRLKREENKLSLKALAEKLKIDTGLLSKIERNKRMATRDHILNISKLFKIPVKELLIIWLSDKIIYDLRNESFGKEAVELSLIKLNQSI